MKVIGTQGVHINKTGVSTSGTKWISTSRTITAAQANNIDFYPLIQFTVQNSTFPQAVFNASINWTIYPNDGSSKRATWSGKYSFGGFLFFNNTSDKGCIYDQFLRKIWSEGNYYGDVGAFNNSLTGVFGFQIKSALNRDSILSMSGEFSCNRWDVITNITCVNAV